MHRNSDEKEEKRAVNKPIDTSVAKLINKYEWRKITDRAKTGTGKAAKKDPEWYIILDPVFSETYSKLSLASQANDILFSNSSDEESWGCDNHLEDKPCDKLHKRDVFPNESANTVSGDETEKTETINRR